MNRARKSVFIGSSHSARRIAEEVKRHLVSKGLDVDIWDEGIFPASQVTIEALEDAPSTYDFSVLILTPHHEVTNNNKDAFLPSCNVVFELGLFMGSIGRKRTFTICDIKVLDSMFADLAGVTVAKFRFGHESEKKDLDAACNTIQRAINSFGYEAIMERPCNVAFLIYPNDRFHSEVLRGFSMEMRLSRILSPQQDEHLRAIAVVVVPGSKDWWEEPVVRKATEELGKRNIHLVCIENGPERCYEIPLSLTVIRSNSRKGAQELAKHSIELLQSDSANVLLLFPRFSDNALTRRDIFEEMFVNQGVNVVKANTATWNEAEAHKTVSELVKAGERYSLVVCGNDEMALGAACALQRSNAEVPSVIGYNGTLRGIAAVAEPSSPIKATMRIPPTHYGKEAARQISDILRGVKEEPEPGNCDCIDIPFDTMNLVTEAKALKILEDAIWDI